MALFVVLASVGNDDEVVDPGVGMVDGPGDGDGLMKNGGGCGGAGGACVEDEG